jgi:hypothetical protein
LDTDSDPDTVLKIKILNEKLHIKHLKEKYFLLQYSFFCCTGSQSTYLSNERQHFEKFRCKNINDRISIRICKGRINYVDPNPNKNLSDTQHWLAASTYKQWLKLMSKDYRCCMVPYIPVPVLCHNSIIVFIIAKNNFILRNTSQTLGYC